MSATHEAICLDDGTRTPLVMAAYVGATCEVCTSAPAHWQATNTGELFCEACTGDLNWRIVPIR